MIRRGFWLAAGAVLGVAGYRRVTRLAKVLAVPRSPGHLPGPARTAGPQMLAPPSRPGSQVARAVATARFIRDVRDGMAEYRDLHRRAPDPTARGRTLDSPALEGRTLETQGYRAPSGEPAESGRSRRGPLEP